MHEDASLPVGQQLARMRWSTQASGAAFDRKKTSYLTQQAQEFIVQQAFCTIAGLDAHGELYGSLVMGHPGFVQVLNSHTCLLRLDRQSCIPQLLHGLQRAHFTERTSRLGLFFIHHPTRERLCVQGDAELLTSRVLELRHSSEMLETTWVRFHVQQAFFHCTKYVKTSIDGLTSIAPVPTEPEWHFQHVAEQPAAALSAEMYAFIAKQVVSFLCTVDSEGHCAVNHRGGAPGFLVALPPDESTPGGIILLPDYAGNGAFEAIGNILETGRAALVIPNYVSQTALCLSGQACILEVSQLADEQARRCIGAERVIALAVQRVVVQRGDWSDTLAYERSRAQAALTSWTTEAEDGCSIKR